MQANMVVPSFEDCHPRPTRQNLLRCVKDGRNILVGKLSLQGKRSGSDDDLCPFFDAIDQGRSQVPEGLSRSCAGLDQQVQLVAHSLVDSFSHRDLARPLLTTHLRDGSAEQVTTHLADVCRLRPHHKPLQPRPLEQGEGERRHECHQQCDQ